MFVRWALCSTTLFPKRGAVFSSETSKRPSDWWTTTREQCRWENCRPDTWFQLSGNTAIHAQSSSAYVFSIWDNSSTWYNSSIGIIPVFWITAINAPIYTAVSITRDSWLPGIIYDQHCEFLILTRQKIETPLGFPGESIYPPMRPKFKTFAVILPRELLSTAMLYFVWCLLLELLLRRGRSGMYVRHALRAHSSYLSCREVEQPLCQTFIFG